MCVPRELETVFSTKKEKKKKRERLRVETEREFGIRRYTYIVAKAMA